MIITVHGTYHFRVVCVQGNRAEVKDNNGKLTWYHISDIKKTDMVTKLKNR